jgi:tetratricopeptide (TPR) repeat protein
MQLDTDTYSMCSRLLQDLRDKGNAAFKSGQWQEAIDFYTQGRQPLSGVWSGSREGGSLLAPLLAALSLDSSSAKCFHNRAIVHLKLKSLDAALRDAQSAIDCDRGYAKAYSTKGSVLLLMGRKAEGIAAYKAGLEASPGDSSLLERLRDAERPAVSQTASTGRSSGSAPWASGLGAGASGSHRPTVPQSPLQPVLEAGRVFLLLLALVSVLPIPFSGRVYTFLMWVATALHALQLFLAHGTPRLSQEYAVHLIEGTS